MRKHQGALGLLAVAVLPLLLALGDQLFETDPAQYAEVARRIYRTGDLFSLHDNFGAFLNKPPVTMWLAAAAMPVLGVTSAAFRLPALLAALVLFAAVARIGELCWDRRTGLIAAVFVAGSFALQLMVLDPKVDMVVTCTMALTVWALLEARQRPRMLWLAWAFAALGVLTKGPIGMAVPAAAVVPEALRRRWGAGAPGTLWARLIAFKPVRGLGIVAALMAPWYAALVGEHGWGGPKYLLWEQSFSRVLHQSDYRNNTTPLFFLHTALWAFLPFTPILLHELVQAARKLARRRSLPPDETRVIWWWLLIPFAVISFSEFRLPQYLYWLTPPAALLSARALSRAAEEKSSGFFKAFSGISLALAIASCALVVLALEGGFPPSSGALEAGWIAAAVALPGGLVVLTRRLEQPERLAGLCIASTAGLALFFAGYLHAAIGEFQPSRVFGALAKQLDPNGPTLHAIVVSGDNATAYYADRPVTEIGLEDLPEAVRAGRVTLAVTEAAHLPGIAERGLEVELVAERPSFPVSRPSGKFLRARTRPEVVQRMVMIRLRARSP